MNCEEFWGRDDDETAISSSCGISDESSSLSLDSIKEFQCLHFSVETCKTPPRVGEARIVTVVGVACKILKGPNQGLSTLSNFRFGKRDLCTNTN